MNLGYGKKREAEAAGIRNVRLRNVSLGAGARMTGGGGGGGGGEVNSNAPALLKCHPVHYQASSICTSSFIYLTSAHHLLAH